MNKISGSIQLATKFLHSHIISMQFNIRPLCFQKNISNLNCKYRILHAQLAERKASPEIPKYLLENFRISIYRDPDCPSDHNGLMRYHEIPLMNSVKSGMPEIELK